MKTPILSSIQQTLTADAAAVLTQSISEASRRSHSQTTPLHVAAALLGAPNGVLRKACVISHPHSSHHPLQCRALDLCFSVALDRLPSSLNAGNCAAEPPISNALMAALKRAQAHQRRGCPEQQQQPLLAVKVELEQLVISILDDPSVSRVMREAKFSSTAVKAAIEQPAPLAIGVASNRNVYVSPRLQQQQMATGYGASGMRTAGDEVKWVMDILVRSKKRNPVLVGDSDPDAVMKQVLQRIESGAAPAPLALAKVVSFAGKLSSCSDRSEILRIIGEISGLIELQLIGSDTVGVVVDLGDLKWLVESPGGGGASIQSQKPVISEAGCAVVAEMTSLLKKFEEGGRLWIVGTASCATFLRCQVYHPTMENDWDIQAVPIAPKSRLSCVLPRYEGSCILSSSVETLAPTKGISNMGSMITSFRPLNNVDSSQAIILCPTCKESYEQELAKLAAKEFEKSTVKQDANKVLPQWLQLTKPKEQDHMWKQSKEELSKKWQTTCSCLHPNFYLMLHGVQQSLVSSKPPSFLNSCSPLKPNLLLSQSPSLEETKRRPENVALEQPSKQESSPPGSPVKTDLELGNLKFSNSPVENVQKERVKELTGCTNDEFFAPLKAKLSTISDIDSYKRLYKGLVEKVSWQQEAASAIASAVVPRKSSNGRKLGGGTKGNTWLLFLGPDKVGKMKMASALSELVFTGGPTIVSFSSCANSNDGEPNFSSRGRTAIDRIVEAVRRNPFSLIVLEDVDQADSLVQGIIKRAIESGRLPDSYGRETSLGSAIFVLTSCWMPPELQSSFKSLIQREEELFQLASIGWQMELSSISNHLKRQGDCLEDHDKPIKMQRRSLSKKGLSLDLNLEAGTDYEAGEGSGNSSDISFEHEHDKGKLSVKFSMSSRGSELLKLVDNSIMFKPVDFGPLRKSILESISRNFETIIGNRQSIKVDDDALDRIVAGLWFSGSVFDEWVDSVFIPCLKQLKFNLKANDTIVVLRLPLTKGCQVRKISSSNCLPRTVAIAID